MCLEHAPQRARQAPSPWAQQQVSQLPPDTPRILRLPETCYITGLTNQQIWLMEQDARFPKRFKLNPDAPKNGAAGHDYHEVMAWVDARRRSREVAR